MEIKKALLDDLETTSNLFDLYRQFYKQESDLDSAKEFISNRIKNNESEIFLAIDEKNNKGMGFVQLYPAFTSVGMKRIWILNDLYVHEDYRKQGVGEALMKKAEEFARETKARGLSLETHSENFSAQKLYDKTGYSRDTEYFRYHLKF